MTGTSNVFFPRHFYNLSLASSSGASGGSTALPSFSQSAHPSIPDPKPEDHLHYIRHALSPPGNLEATRAAG